MGAVIARGTQTGAIWVALLFFGLLNERCVRARLWECEHFEAGDAEQCGLGAAPVGTAAGRGGPLRGLCIMAGDCANVRPHPIRLRCVRAPFRLFRTSCEK